MTTKGNTTDRRFGGKMIKHNGMVKNIGDWAKHYGRQPSSLTCLAKSCGSVKKALELYEGGLKNRCAVIYTYTGKEFVAISGQTITTGMTGTLQKWQEMCGINKGTLWSRINRTIAAPQDAFNRAIAEPPKEIGRGTKPPFEDIAERTAKMVVGAKAKRAMAVELPREPMVTTMDIIICRQQHQDRRCSPCPSRLLCYGR